eukprot:10472758-Lingulodinium_polyedra.AAC.1
MAVGAALQLHNSRLPLEEPRQARASWIRLPSGVADRPVVDIHICTTATVRTACNSEIAGWTSIYTL